MSRFLVLSNSITSLKMWWKLLAIAGAIFIIPLIVVTVAKAETPMANLYPLTMDVQLAINNGPDVAYVITVKNSSASHMAFGPWVELDWFYPILSSSQPLLKWLVPVSTPGGQPKAWFVGRLKPGQSKSLEIHIPFSLGSGYCTYAILHDLHYWFSTRVEVCGNMK